MQEFGIFFPTLAFFLLLVSPVNIIKHNTLMPCINTVYRSFFDVIPRNKCNS